MEIEELKKAIATEEGKLFLDTITGPLLNKNKELLSELKRAKASDPGLGDDELESLRNKAKKADEYEHQQLEAKGEYETLLSKMREQMTKSDTEKDATIAELRGQLQKHVVEGGLRKELGRVGVAPEVMDVLLPSLSSEVQLVDGIPVVGAHSLETHVDDWAKGDQAKYFIKTGNTGGGSTGGGTSGSEDDYEQYFKPESMNRTKQAELMSIDADRYKVLREKYPAVNPSTAHQAAPGMNRPGRI